MYGVSECEQNAGAESGINEAAEFYLRRPKDVLPMHGASADTGHDLLPGCDRA